MFASSTKRLRVPNETPSTLSEAQVPKPIPRDNGLILIWSKISARSRPSLAIASGIDMVNFLRAGHLSNV